MNRARTRRIFRNFGSLTTGKFFGHVSTFLLFVVLSRTFGQHGIGQYSFAMGLTCFFVVFSEFGLYNLSIKEMSRRTDSLGDYCGGIFTLRLILSVGVFGVLLLVLPFLPFSFETKLIVVLIGAYQVIYKLMDGFTAVFVAREDMYLAGLMEFSLRAVIALAGITVIMTGGSLVMALATMPAVTFGHLCVAYGIVTKKYGRPRLAASYSSLMHTLREAIPYTLSAISSPLFTRVDVVFLGFFLGAAAAGVYNVAYRVVFVLGFIPHFAALALFPMASRLYVHSRKQLEALYHQSLNLMILIGLPAAFGLWLIAPDLINLVFGNAFAESASLLRFLAWLMFLWFLRSIMAIFLMSCDRQVERTKSQWIAASVNVLGNLLLIPTFGVKGAAITTLISEALLVILFAVRLGSVLGLPRVGSRLGISGVATACFWVPFAFFPTLSSGVVIPASLLLYSGTLALFKQIRRNEIRTLVSLLKGDSGKMASTGHEVS
ncbi:MAG: flippase [Fidelibacterota bacterium]